MIAKEFLSFYQKNRVPAILYKVDFSKAFDSVSWTFLTNVLIERGFPPAWISWVLAILTSSSFSVKVNGDATEVFLHKKGLRQGDLLSPMLFILAVDALQSFITNAAPLLNGQIIIPPGHYSQIPVLGRTTDLVKSVLTALPLHYMQVIKLPAWLIEQLDKIRRSFFWKGKDKCLGGHCLVNWAKCCIPKKCGGLGVLNLSSQNDALLLRWLWKLQKEPDSIWATSINLLFGTTDIDLLRQDNRVSNAFKDILSLKDFYRSSTSWVGGTQRIIWKWEPFGFYSSTSAYGILSYPGIRSPYHNLLWKIKAPPKVRIFIWILLLDRLLMQQNLTIKNWPSIASCICCNHGIEETASHLFVLCDFAVQVWTLIQVHFGLLAMIFALEVDRFWLQNRKSIGPSWDIIWAAVSWSIWKERNRRIFSSKRLSPQLLCIEILSAISAWSSSA
ncbi:hypothetical protein LUZ61_014653 [Rhynchospora tenuis]|uniref:Reverse transcriptase domain-containing protein n=1 Tax=Rhynchospora tenuis TaxID=198213 RepID=A0AAD5WBQ3_9POAL|nr:hypothetical protein LUZ61_014653 [Rhynchospora tenuis]